MKQQKKNFHREILVLILIVMEDTHEGCSCTSHWTSCVCVLILIVMEDTHEVL